MIVLRYYENLSVLHENTMPARAYYIPASRRMDNLVEHREESDRMQLLNGTWKFQYFNSIYDIQDSFFEKNYDTENAEELNIRITKLLEQRRLLREKYSKAMREGTELNVKLNPADQDFLARLNDYIYALISNHGLNSDMVDDKMCMSRSQLNRKVRAITGYNTSAYILQMRMERSKRLLASTEELIGDIALKCGFEDANYFARLFKQIFNVTPSQYRKSLIQ